MVDLYVDAIKRTFGERVVCLLFYGSRACPDRTVRPTSDYDFCLVLDAPVPEDLHKLRRLCLEYDRTDTIFYYLSELEQRGWHNFQLGNHGVFSLLYLASAKPVIGTNIFDPKTSLVDGTKVRKSLRFQVMEYLWRLDSWILNLQSEEELIQKMQKYLLRISHDMQAMQGDLSFREINEYNNQYYLDNHIDDKDYFSETSKRLLKRLSDSPELSELIALKESLKEDFLALEQVSLSSVEGQTQVSRGIAAESKTLSVIQRSLPRFI
jgi:hypothetical protein